MRRFVVLGIAVLVVLAVVGLGTWYLAGSAANPAPLEPVTVAYSPFESSGLFLVAEDRGFFAENGLNLTLYRSDSGASALNDMVGGKAEVAVSVSEFPLVGKIFQGTPARAFAVIDKAEYIYIVARSDRGIAFPADLRGKRIGTAAGSIAEFHLGRFLSLNGLGMENISYVSVKTPTDTADEVVNGSIDAAVLAQPYADQARERLGGNAIAWEAQSSQPLFALAVSTDGWIARNPDRFTRFLRALAEAESFMADHPAESKAIVQQRLGLDPAYMDTVWRQNRFTLTLDQSLVLAMEDEARWMIGNKLTNATAVPDFRKYIDTAGLEAVKPGSVNVIG
ncbi:MAG TPA: NrtA/SsuA/CpmA family ABC transporter substrate-binding protein [Methanomicrobiales archaeon]|nr:NrtA/SsuA/CpmA family ABC transporter substrate-binding protein [Methanomicrobiales archaeon]